MKKSVKAAVALTAISIMSGASAYASRTVYIPPIFSNQDFSCNYPSNVPGPGPAPLPPGTPVPNDNHHNVGDPYRIFDRFPLCYDFSLTNLSPKAQTVTINWLSAYVKGFAPSDAVLASPTSFTLNFGPNAVGGNKQVSFCAFCAVGGTCNFGPDLDGPGVPHTNAGNGAQLPGATLPPVVLSGQTGTPTDKAAWFYYHANSSFNVSVAEDRGALVGRVTLRVFPGGQGAPSCKEAFTSPAIVVEINGGRAF